MYTEKKFNAETKPKSGSTYLHWTWLQTDITALQISFYLPGTNTLDKKISHYARRYTPNGMIHVQQSFHEIEPVLIDWKLIFWIQGPAAADISHGAIFHQSESRIQDVS